jgi:hypothetical protein
MFFQSEEGENTNDRLNSDSAIPTEPLNESAIAPSYPSGHGRTVIHPCIKFLDKCLVAYRRMKIDKKNDIQNGRRAHSCGLGTLPVASANQA